MKWKLGVCVAALALVMTSCAIGISDLGGSSSEALGINNSGIIVGVAETPDSSPPPIELHAFKRFPDDTVVDLGGLSGHEFSEAVAINDAGVAVGSSAASVDERFSDSRAVMWTPDGSVAEVGPPGLSSRAVDVDDDGLIVGNSAAGPFVYSPVTGQSALLSQLPDSREARVTGMNDVGQAVGWQWVNDSHVYPHAVTWNLDDRSITDLSPTWGDGSILMDVNDSGTMVGYVVTDRVRAAVYPVGASAPTILYDDQSYAFSISDAGFVAGELVNSSDGGLVQGFRWRADVGGVRLSSGSESRARDVNDGGQVVGIADHHAVLLVAV